MEAAAADDHPGQPRPVPQRRACRRCTTRCAAARTCPATRSAGSRARHVRHRRQHLGLGLAARRRRPRRARRRGSPRGASTSSNCRSSSPATGTRCTRAGPAGRRTASARSVSARSCRRAGSWSTPRPRRSRRPQDVPAGLRGRARRPSARRCVGGPVYASVGRTWRMSPASARGLLRRVAASTWRRSPSYAGERGVRIGVEPLNRYETSVVNTVEQTARADRRTACERRHHDRHLPHEHRGEGPVRGRSALARASTSSTSRSAAPTGARPVPTTSTGRASSRSLRDTGYPGAARASSRSRRRTQTIATAASIWRPLAPTQDRLATDGLRYLRVSSPALPPQPVDA